MKLLTLFALVLVTQSLFAKEHAELNLTKTNKEICETEAAKSLMGAAGSCKVLVVPQNKLTKGGECTAKLANASCTITYAIIEMDSAIIMKCGDLDQEMMASTSTYRVAALVKGDDGKQVFIDDQNSYTDIVSKLITISIAEAPEQAPKVKISLNFGLSAVDLTDVSCTE